MIKSILNFLSLTLSPEQEKIVELIKSALQEKRYVVNENSFFYDEGRHHSLNVEIHLSPNLHVALNTLFADKKIFGRDPQVLDQKFMDIPELSSSTAYNLIIKHFENILWDERDKAEQERQKKQDSLTQNLKSL